MTDICVKLVSVTGRIHGSNIGKPKRKITVAPSPAQPPRRETAPQPVRTPQREPEKVPA